MKLDWKKTDKELYLPGRKPSVIEVPALQFFTISGRGDPNTPEFGEYVGVLYSLSYYIRMSPKSGRAPKGYYEYTVFPLEGVWDISEDAKKAGSTALDKSTFVYTLMIRQPDFVTPQYAEEVIAGAAKKTPNPLLEKVRFEKLKEGLCVQMLHIGSYDSEPASFKLMEGFCGGEGLYRSDKRHREIYISNPGRTAPEKLKTVLRFSAGRIGA